MRRGEGGGKRKYENEVGYNDEEIDGIVPHHVFFLITAASSHIVFEDLVVLRVLHDVIMGWKSL